MILPLTTFISLLLVSPSWAGLSAREFETFIEPKCFRLNEKEVPYVNGQENPLASTLENFIALAEKFEAANPRTGFKEELFYFIRNYTYTNIEYNSIGDIVRWNPKDANYANIDTMWEPEEGIRTSLPRVEDPFTDAEKCSLYFMISHSIVRKSRKVDIQRAVVMQNNTNTNNNRFSTDLDYNDEDLYPLEQGVVAIQGTEEAVSLGRVLTGMYVGLNRGRKREIDTYGIPKEYIPAVGTVVDPLYTLTIAEVIAMAGWRPEAGQRQKLAKNGYWKSIPINSNIETKDICPMIYRLHDATEEAYSFSSMRGAADGLILGKVIEAIESKKQDVKLSQILRQYYSRGGFVVSVPDLDVIRATFCNREFLLGNWEEMIKEQVRLFLLLASTSYKNIEDSLTFAWKQYTDAKTLGVFHQNLDHLNRVIKDYCGASLSVDQPRDLPLETPLDVIAVINTRSNDEINFKRQQSIIGSLAKRMQLSHSGSRMTIFTDQRDQTSSVSVPGMIYLKPIVENTYSPSCAACLVTQIKRDQSTGTPEDEVIIALNQYLTAKMENETQYSGVNGKVVILFNFEENVPKGRPDASETRLRTALQNLFRDHKGLSIYALGKNMDVLKRYAGDDTAFTMSAFDLSEDDTAKELYGKLIATPGKLQYSDCQEAKNERNAVFEEYVSPNSIQHWAMPAKYFHKSYNIKITFESFYGPAKVCYNRATTSPEQQQDTCKDISAGKPHTYSESNPCKGVSEYACAPFYFAVMGVNMTDDKEMCDDKLTENKCKTLDQIKFKITHEGIRCSGTTGLIASSLILAFAVIVSHIFSKFV